MANVDAVTQQVLDNMANKVVRYPDPFFDLSKNYIPSNIKTLFGFCKNLFYTNSYLRNVINKMTQYPITDIMYSSNIELKTRDTYDVILHDKLKIKSFLIGVGMDYYTYGNSIVTAYSVPKRFLKCSKCGFEEPIENIKYKFRNFKFEGKCKKCHAVTNFTISDSKIKSMSNFKLVRLNPEHVDIKYNSFTGDSTYFYNIPNNIKKSITLGESETLATVPEAFIESVRVKKAVKLDNANLYHLKYPSLSETDMGWAKPPILPALKEIFYLQTLRRGNEAIIHEHLVPKKSIFPSAGGVIDPFSKINLGEWKGKIEMQLKKWKIDPNHIAVFPIPIGYQELGGNAKMLMLTPEMRFLEESIINSLGVPLEFIKGGTTWTGSSVSLRIVENGFLNYREHLRDLMNYFIIPKIAGYLKIPKISIYFKKFKMNDDSEFKQLLIQMFQAKGISKTRLLEEMGLNAQEELEALESDSVKNIDEFMANEAARGIAAGEQQIMAAKYQGRAQEELEKQPLKRKIEMFEEELIAELGNPNEDLFTVIDKIAFSIKSLPDAIRNQQLISMANSTPITFGLVQERLVYYLANEMNIISQSQMGAMESEEVKKPENKTSNNKKELGEREEDKVEVKGEKHKGPTKGEA